MIAHFRLQFSFYLGPYRHYRYLYPPTNQRSINYASSNFFSLLRTRPLSVPLAPISDVCSPCRGFTNKSSSTRPSNVPGNGNPILCSTVGTISYNSAFDALKPCLMPPP